MKSKSTISRGIACLSLTLLLAACDKSPQNAVPPAPVPAPASVAAPATAAAPRPATAPAATIAAAPTTASAASSAPAVSSAATASSTAVPAAASDNGPEIAGSVAIAQGSVSDTAKDGSVRELKDGDDVYPGDSFVVGPDSYLDMDLEDTGRILLRPNTKFQIESYHFEPAVHDPNGPTDASGQPLIKPQQPENAFFHLVKGGLRAVDGLIGRTSPQNYGVETPVATIGVRGTAFDVRYCGDDCTDETDASGKPANGLYTSVTDGSVDVKNDGGDVVTPAGHSGFVKSRKQRMQALAVPPKALRHMGLPEALKARAERNRSQIHLRRQQRQQRMIERQRAAAEKARVAGKAPPESPRERPQQRQEERRGAAQGLQPADRATRMQRREERRARQEQKRAASSRPENAVAPPVQAPAEGQALTPPEQRQERREERQQQHQQRHPDEATAPPSARRVAQPAAKPHRRGEARCKGKRRREKEKGTCGGG